MAPLWLGDSVSREPSQLLLGWAAISNVSLLPSNLFLAHLKLPVSFLNHSLSRHHKILLHFSLCYWNSNRCNGNRFFFLQLYQGFLKVKPDTYTELSRSYMLVTTCPSLLLQLQLLREKSLSKGWSGYTQLPTSSGLSVLPSLVSSLFRCPHGYYKQWSFVCVLNHVSQKYLPLPPHLIHPWLPA